MTGRTYDPIGKRSSVACVDGGGDWLGGAEGYGGVPAGGHGYFASHGRGADIADELRRTRGPRKPRDPGRRWWRFWRRHARADRDEKRDFPIAVR